MKQRSSAKKSAKTEAEATPPASGEQQPLITEDASAAPAPARSRRARKAAEPVRDIDPRYLNNEDEMQYALLLALLLQRNGTVRLSAEDLALADTDYNIVFARTRDGRFLEVTAVSAQSGIIRSPEKRKEAQQWNAAAKAPEPPPPSYVPLPEMVTGRGEVLEMETPRIFPTQQFVPRTNPPAETMQDQVRGGVAGAVLPRTDPAETKDGSTPYRFPFEVGTAPSSAQKVDLSAASRRLLEKDQQIAIEQQTAAARVEEQGG